MQANSSAFVALVVSLRLLNAILVTTQLDPDEWWQAPEVAHRLVFGCGVLTWEWEHGLRGYTHVLPFALGMQALKMLRLDSPLAIAMLPRLMQGVLAAVGDLLLRRLATRYFGSDEAGRCALLSFATSWFVAICGVRTYSSTAEATLLLAALCLLPLPGMSKAPSWRCHSYAVCHSCAVPLRPSGTQPRALSALQRSASAAQKPVVACGAAANACQRRSPRACRHRQAPRRARAHAAAHTRAPRRRGRALGSRAARPPDGRAAARAHHRALARAAQPRRALLLPPRGCRRRRRHPAAAAAVAAAAAAAVGAARGARGVAVLPARLAGRRGCARGVRGQAGGSREPQQRRQRRRRRRRRRRRARNGQRRAAATRPLPAARGLDSV